MYCRQQALGQRLDDNYVNCSHFVISLLSVTHYYLCTETLDDIIPSHYRHTGLPRYSVIFCAAVS